jgi:hypothetical protein
LVIDGDPLDDITILEERSRLRLIMKEGAIVKNRLETRNLEFGEAKEMYGDVKWQL